MHKFAKLALTMALSMGLAVNAHALEVGYYAKFVDGEEVANLQVVSNDQENGSSYVQIVAKAPKDDERLHLGGYALAEAQGEKLIFTVSRTNEAPRDSILRWVDENLDTSVGEDLLTKPVGLPQEADLYSCFIPYTDQDRQSYTVKSISKMPVDISGTYVLQTELGAYPDGTLIRAYLESLDSNITGLEMQNWYTYSIREVDLLESGERAFAVWTTGSDNFRRLFVVTADLGKVYITDSALIQPESQMKLVKG